MKHYEDEEAGRLEGQYNDAVAAFSYVETLLAAALSTGRQREVLAASDAVTEARHRFYVAKLAWEKQRASTLTSGTRSDPSGITPNISPDRDLARLAQRIVTYESARVSAVRPSEFFETWEKLHRPLSELAGPAGVWSLFGRALALARLEVPALKEVQLRPDGALVGLSEIGDGIMHLRPASYSSPNSSH